MARATWNGRVLAESDDTRVVEGNHYFPEQSLNKEYFEGSDHHSLCPWKGIASYYTVEVDSATRMRPGTTPDPLFPPARSRAGSPSGGE